MQTLNDAVWRDSRSAAALFAVASALLLVGAVIGLNSWPAQDTARSLANANAVQTFLALHGYSLVIVVCFWGSRPSHRLQVAVLAAWGLTTPVLWHYVGAQLWAGTHPARGFPIEMFLASSLAVPCLFALLWRVSQCPAGPMETEFALRLRWLVALALLFTLIPQAALSLTWTLHPHTYDLFALHFDRSAGLNVAPALISAIHDLPGLRQLVSIAYGLTPLGFLAVALLHLRGKPEHVASALLTWVVLSTSSLLAYHAFPISGPVYLFGADGFAKALLSTSAQPLDFAAMPAVPRNGMPSMHFGWLLAASILWWRSATRARSRLIILSLNGLTALATLTTGEHYVIDLIVAVPFVLGAIALSSTGVSWAGSKRAAIVWAGFGAWLAWIVLLRTQISRFMDSPGLCWLLILATVVVVVQQARWMAGLRAAAAPQAMQSSSGRWAADAQQQTLTRRFGVMFFASGVAALIYQVLFAKELALVFGSTATATFTVLATFLGGMAIGSLIGGWLANRLARPLLAYALVEAGIAVYCVLTPALFQGVQAAYIALASGTAPDAPQLLALRVALGAVVLLLPTVLMGTTLPLLAQAIGPQAGRMGMRVAGLYFTNTAGAALGALLTAYFIIPALGVHKTTLIAAVMNLLVALGALELAKRSALTFAQIAGGPPPIDAASVDPGRAARVAALAALGLGGVLSLGLEVVYVHMLAIVAGNSVYAFGLMVATFLVGLSLGGEVARRVLLRDPAVPAFGLGLALLGLSASVALGATFWNGIPDYFASYAQYPAAHTFASREAIRGLVCALVMVPPTLFIGASYVLAMDIVTSGKQRSKALLLGTGAAVNTAGNIVGVLLFGFWLLPALGGLQTGVLIAALALGLAVMVLAVAGQWLRTLAPLAVAGLALAAASGVQLDYARIGSGANVYFFPQRWGEVIAYAESIDGGLTMVAQQKTGDGRLAHTLLTNGKFQGSDAEDGEMQAQIGFALAPLLHQSARQRALVIGYGTGVTSRVFHEAGFRQVDIAELSRDIVTLADRYFGKVNARASSLPGVQLHVTDGRNLLLLTDRRYDVISIEITSIWFAGAASLYNREFYALARSRLAEGGVLQQWVQLHRLSPFDILQVINTLRAEFRYVSLYVMGSQGILVAGNDAQRAQPQADAIAALAQSPGLAEIRRIAGRPAERLLEDRWLDPEGVDRFIAGSTNAPEAWISTDDNLRLEYDTPKANVNDGAKSFANNKALLQRYR